MFHGLRDLTVITDSPFLEPCMRNQISPTIGVLCRALKRNCCTLVRMVHFLRLFQIILSVSRDPWCHGSGRDACPQGQPGVARPSDTSAENIGGKECRESRRKHMDRSDGSGREYWRIGRTHQITCRLEISMLIMGLDMIG